MKVTKRIELIERVIVHYDKDDRDKIFDKYYSDGFQVIYSGPKHVGGLRFSTTRLKVVFERKARHYCEKYVIRRRRKEAES